MRKPTARIQAALTAALRTHIGAERYDLWFEGNTRIVVDDDGLTVKATNTFFRDWLEAEFRREIAAACRETFGKAVKVTFSIDATGGEVYKGEPAGTEKKSGAAASKKDKNRRSDKANPESAVKQPANAPSNAIALASAAATNAGVKKNAPPSQPAATRETRKPARAPRYSLDGFVVGAPNRIGYASAVALVEQPRHAISPLYIYGGIGVGKTHLLRGAEEGLRGREGVKAACYNCEEFANDFIESYKANKLPAFRKRIRALDILLIDDVQFLAGKRATQEELVYALDAIHLRGGKVILTGGEHPRRLTKVGEDLRSRFLAGMAAKLDPPNREMRRQIVARRIESLGVPLSDDVVFFIADQIRANVRELEGAVNYVVHHARSQPEPLTVADVRSALSDLLRHVSPILDLPTVLAKACAFFGVAKARLADKSRTKTVSQQRAVFVYLLRRFTGAAYSEIGRLLGGFNHSTMIAAERRVRDGLQKDPTVMIGDRRWKTRDAVESLERELGVSSNA